MFFGERADSRYLLVGAPHGQIAARSVSRRLDPHGKKLRVQSARFHIRRVEMKIGSVVDVRAFVDDELHGVCVHVDSDGATVD